MAQSLLRRLLDDCSNIVAIKAEGGFPSIMGVIECHRHFGEEVVISCPIEGELIPLSQLMPIQLSATSDHEYYGPMIPRVFAHLRAGEFDEATEICARGCSTPGCHPAWTRTRSSSAAEPSDRAAPARVRQASSRSRACVRCER